MGCEADELPSKPRVCAAVLAPEWLLASSTLTMLLSLAPLAVSLLPFVAEAKVHKLKLQKLAPAANNPQLESAWLAEKYGVSAQAQMPLMGAGGTGRQISRPTSENGETLFWTQGEEVKGGHGVPLSSEFIFKHYQLCHNGIQHSRLHECPVFH